jgi:hypothetical protein
MVWCGVVRLLWLFVAFINLIDSTTTTKSSRPSMDFFMDFLRSKDFV